MINKSPTKKHLGDDPDMEDPRPSGIRRVGSKKAGRASGTKVGAKSGAGGAKMSDADKLKCFTGSMKKAIATLEEKLRQSAAFTFHDVEYGLDSLEKLQHGPLRRVGISFFIMGPRGMRVSYYGSFRYDREDFLEGTLYVQGHGQTKVDFTRAKCVEIAKVIATLSTIPKVDMRIAAGSGRGAGAGRAAGRAAARWVPVPAPEVSRYHGRFNLWEDADRSLMVVELLPDRNDQDAHYRVRLFEHVGRSGYDMQESQVSLNEIWQHLNEAERAGLVRYPGLRQRYALSLGIHKVAHGHGMARAETYEEIPSGIREALVKGEVPWSERRKGRASGHSSGRSHAKPSRVAEALRASGFKAESRETPPEVTLSDGRFIFVAKPYGGDWKGSWYSGRGAQPKALTEESWGPTIGATSKAVAAWIAASWGAR